MSVLLRKCTELSRFRNLIFIKLKDINNLNKNYLNINNIRNLPKLPVFFALSLGFGIGKSEKSEIKLVDKQKNESIVNKEKQKMDLTETFRHADQLYDQNHFQEAIDLLKTITESSASVEWRLARAYYNFSKTLDKKKREEAIRKAYDHSKKSLELDDKEYASHKWYAVLIDAKAELDGVKERASKLNEVKHHMIEAVRLNPNDPTSWYLLGSFAFGIADMPWYQKKIVATLFATPPSASYEEALEHFTKAEDISPDFYSMNKLMLGKCYLRLKDNEKAKHYLTLASKIGINNEDDKKCKEEADQLLKKL